jgi:general secretion pathway protein K
MRWLSKIAKIARPRRPRRRGDERGVALILVMSSIALMTITVVDFQDEQTADLQAAFAQRDALQAEYVAKSGVNLSRLFLASEPMMRQGLPMLRLLMGGKALPQLPVWEFAPQVLGAFSDKEGQEQFASLSGFDINGGKNLVLPSGASFTASGGGCASPCIVDEDAKINLNLGARGNVIAQNRFGSAFLGLTAGPPNDPLFERPDRDGQQSDRVTICGALMDWADPDEARYTCDPRNFQGGGAGVGAEDLSMTSLPRPYRPKNAPYDSLEEARLVRGVGDDFFATFIDPDPSNPKKRVMTVWGQGPINVNTAPAQAVLAVVCGLAPDAIVCADATKTVAFLSMLGVLKTFTSGIPLFSTPADFVATMQGQGPYGKMLFEGIGVPPVRFQSPSDAAKNFTTESKVFSIYSTGEVVGYKRTTRVRIHAVVDFRTAPPIPGGLGGLGGVAGQAGIPGAGAAGGVSQPAAGAGGANTGPDSIIGALAADPAGTVIYYRIE